MFFQFSGKVALVTGGSSGMGRATAIAYAKEGIKVVVADRNVQGGEETVSLIKANGGEAIFIQCDVSKEDQVENLVKKTIEAYGRVDYAFNNAGIPAQQIEFVDFDAETYDKISDVDLKGYWLCMKYEISQMLSQGGGVIVNTASVVGIRGGRRGAPYVAFKHGVVGLSKSAALEYALQNIRVNCVCPGEIDTAMNPLADAPPGAVEAVPMHRFGTPEDIAPAVLFLCCDGASYITGQNLVVDGGQSCGI